MFDRPNPKNATVDDIKKAIDDITKWDWKTGYSFAHTVIDDMNLSDGSILFCLQPHLIARVMTQMTIDTFGHTEFLKLKEHERAIYHNDIITHMVEIIKLLDWLLDIPIEIRDKVE